MNAKSWIATVGLALCLLVHPVQADQLDDATSAYSRGDYETAIRLFRPLAKQDVAAAQFALGFMYNQGTGVVQDYAEAAKWYRKAAEQGYAKAQNNLGVMYDNGDGVAEDDVEAVNWFRKAAEHGHAGAQNSLGLMYYTGTGVKRNLINAYAWVSIAAAGDEENAKIGKAIVSKEMTKEEIAEAEKRSAEILKSIKKP